jgi:uncharacterized protein YjiS (DUF1127 family)
MKASKISTDNRSIGHQSRIVEGRDDPVTDSRQISRYQELWENLMFAKMQPSVYQNRGGSQHHAPSVNDVRFGGIDTKISVDQKLVPAPRPTVENAAAREVIPPAMSTVTGTDRANLDGLTSPHIAQRSRRNWLTSSWEVVAALWAHWRREREIRKTVSALAELDERTLRDIGIPHRSQIEQAVRYCRDC